jgi:iron complex transport system substrate-binding protein
MNITMLNRPLFAILTAIIFTFALFSPTVKEHVLVPARVSSVQTTAIFPTIVSAYATINEGSGHILGISKPARETAAAGLLSHIYPVLERIPVISPTVIPDPEQVLYLCPDAVFVYSGQAGLLKKIGLPGVIEIMVNPKQPIKSREKIWLQMGEVAGKSARTAILLNRYAAGLATLQRQLPPDTTRKTRVAYILANNGEWWTTNRNYYVAYKLELAGAQNVSSDFKYAANAKADLEQLLLADPDVILFTTNMGDHTTMDEIAGRPEFQALRAVRERRIYKFPEHNYMNEPVEDPLLLTWIAEIFYPETMPRRLRDEYRDTYRDVYHYAISDDKIDKAIYMGENRHSAGYERFTHQ